MHTSAELTLTLRQGSPAMRQLIGKIPSKDPNVSQRVYLSESLRCRECQKMVPMGIEIITIKKGESNSVVNHRCYCFAHGREYEIRAQILPIRSHANVGREAALRIK